MTQTTDLDTRTQLPDEWRFLLNDYPREVWGGHENLGPLMQFWLARHDGFRQMGATLDQALTRFREGEVDAQQFGRFFGPRLQQFLGELEGHHQIEDHHYFPVFMAAEKRLAAGFELLEGDHELIHHRIGLVVNSANALFRQLQTGDRDKIRRLADAYAETSDVLVAGLMRHLDDEEDLIVPLVLDRTEAALGVG
jgi:hemerythrin-like domain-containing protein